MTAQTYNFTGDSRMEQGATLDRTITWFEDDGTTPIDLTGYTARMQVRRSLNATDTILDLTTTNGKLIIASPATGTIQILVDAVTMAAVAITSGVYDLELVSAGGTVTRLLEGQVDVSKEVTR